MRRLSLLVALTWAVGCQAENLGTHGQVYDIAEPDMIEMMKARIQKKIDSGEFERMKEKARARVREQFIDMTPTTGVPSAASEHRVYWYDPTIVVKADIRTPDGTLIVPAGTTVNPLDHEPFLWRWVLFDARDSKQVAWARKQVKDARTVPILVAGKWLDLWKQWQKQVYFDQGGVITRRLGIQGVPAIVSQDPDKRRIRIEEVYLQ